MPQAMQDMFKETWQRELQDIEQRRNDFLPGASEDAEEVTKVAEPAGQKKKQCQKDLGKWAGDSERRNEIEERHAKIEELGQKIQ